MRSYPRIVPMFPPSIRRLRVPAALAFQIFLASVADAPAAPKPPDTAHEAAPVFDASFTAPDAHDAVVLVVVDGMRWQELFQGVGPSLRDVWKPAAAAKLFPNLYALVESRGVILGAPQHGASIVASGPHYVSLPGYAEIFAGRPGTCADNCCAAPAGRTIVDEIRDQATSADQVAVFSSWPTLAKVVAADPSRIVLSTGRRRIEHAELLRADPVAEEILTAGERARVWPWKKDYRLDAFTSKLALRYLATRRPRFLFVSLGDADEYAHRNDYAGYIRALRKVDAFLGELASTLDAMGEAGRRTTVIVTADHGRANSFRAHGRAFPESARVWLAAFGGKVAARGPVPLRATAHLSDIAPAIRAALHLPEGLEAPEAPTSELVSALFAPP